MRPRGLVLDLARFVPALLALLLAPLPLAVGHGGAFRGPNGGVPPGLREPSDPEPPPPPPTDPTPGGTPETGGPDPQGPTSGHSEHGQDTPGGGAPQPGPSGPPGGARGARTTKTVGYDSWRFWWAYNNDEILNVRSPDRGIVTDTGWMAAGRGDRENRRNPRRATQHEIQKCVIPALRGCIDRRDENEDVHGGALIAVAKLGTGAIVPLLDAVLRNRHEDKSGQRIDFGGQARESAVLALGLLPDLDDGARAEVRRILLAAVADETLRTRERTWAAVALGLRRDTEAVAPLLELLPLRYPDDNVPAGILVGLGLIGDGRARPALEEILLEGCFRGKEVPARVRPFAGYALGKLGDAAALPALMRTLASRRMGALVQRSAALAAGALGEHAREDMKAETVATLLKTIRRAGTDATTRNFALVSLGRIGTSDALLALLAEAEDGHPGARAFAALGLGTCVWYADRAAETLGVEPLDPALRRRIVAKLADLSARIHDSETRAAFLLARGLVKDLDARDDLVEIVSRPGDATLRGFACVALGLLGDARPAVKDALYLALAERTNVDLRRDAATGLGLLRDAATVPHLLEQLRTASSFVVQGQVVSALGAIGDQRALAPLVSFLESRNEPAPVRALAAVGLGLIGDPQQVPALARLSRDYNYRASAPDLDELLYIF